MTETEELWAKRIAEWRASGLTAAAYAGRIGVSAGSVNQWHRRLSARIPARPSVALARVARTVPPDAELPADVPAPGEGPRSATPGEVAEAGVEIVLGAGLVVRVRAGFDPALLLVVVGLLGAPRP